MTLRPTAVLICPGRGTYNKSELGTLGRFHTGNPLIATWDAMRADAGQQTLTALDSAQHFAPGRHTTGDNASALIYAAAILMHKRRCKAMTSRLSPAIRWVGTSPWRRGAARMQSEASPS